LDTLRHETEQANQDHEGHQQQLQEALKQIEELKKEVDDKQQNDAEIQKLNERLQEVERERDELLQKHEQAVNEAILVRKDLEQSLASAVRPEEFANLREENTQLKAQLESASVSGHAHAENQEVLQDIDELKARRDALGKEIAQAKATISDAATIMGKNKSLQDKVDALTRENQLLRESDGSSNTAAAAAEPTPAASQAPNPEPVKPVAAKKPTFKPVDASITNHRAGRSFGRGVPSPAAESRHMSGKVPGKKPQDSAKSLMPKGDNRNKFAKSLFGNVNDKNSKK
jgi:uncharacterized phage infection (PIP) family protein YhgE